MIVRLDYQRAAKPFPWAGVALLVLAAAALALSGAYYHHAVERAADWEARSGQLAGDSSLQTATSQQDMTEAALEIRHANHVLGALAIPWDSLLRGLAWSSARNVALLAIEPDAEKHLLRISGEAANISALWDYMGHLTAQESFSRVILRSHQVERRDLKNPVRFALIVEWRVHE
jgi:hypothetical protein